MGHVDPLLKRTGRHLSGQHSPVDQVQVRGQAVALEVTEELRKVLLEEDLKGSEILQHLEEEEEEVTKTKQRTRDEEEESSPVRGQL